VNYEEDVFPELRNIKFTREQVYDILNMAADNIIIGGGSGIPNNLYIPIVEYMVSGKGKPAMEKKFYGYFGQAVNGMPVDTSNVEFSYRGQLYPFKAVYQ